MDEPWTPEMRLRASERAQKPRQPRGTGTVYRTTVRGERVWRAAITVHAPDGESRRIVGTSPDRMTAVTRRDRLYRRWLVSAGLEDESILSDSDAPIHTVASFLTLFLDDVDHERVAANSRARNRGLLRNHIIPHIGDRKLRSVTEAHISQLLNDTLPRKGLGSSPLRGVFYILSQGFKQAERQKLIRVDPTRYLKAPMKTRKNVLRLAERLDDVTRLQRYLSTRPEEHVYWVLTYYGLRASERLGLEWSSFTNLHTDLKKPAVLKIDRQLYNDAESRKLYIKHQTKTEAGTRALVLPDHVRSMFLDLKRRQNVLRKSDSWEPRPGFEHLVYTTSTGNAVRQSTDNARWRRLLEDAGIAPLREHDMRHLTASWLARAGVHPEQAKAILGHASQAMTSFYTHVGIDQTSSAVQQLTVAYSDAQAGRNQKKYLSLIKETSVVDLNE